MTGNTFLEIVKRISYLTLFFVGFWGFASADGFPAPLDDLRGRSLMWLICMVGSVSWITGKCLRTGEETGSAEECLRQAEEQLGYEFRDSSGSAVCGETFRGFSSMFRSRLSLVLRELIGAAPNPMVFMWRLPSRANAIVDLAARNSIGMRGDKQSSEIRQGIRGRK
jgi:hypothetical protein